MILHKQLVCLMLVALFLTTAGAACLNSTSGAVPEPEWVAGTPVLYPFYLAATVQDDDHNLYIIGGRSSITAESYDKVSVYDLKTEQQTMLASMPIGVAGGAAAIGHDGCIYVFGGKNNSYPNLYVAEVQIYDPSTNSWTTGADMPQTLTIAEAVIMPNGLIYVMGGTNSNLVTSTLGNMQIYDPETDTWSIGDSMFEGRYSGAALALTDNVIMYIGGSNIEMAHTYSDWMYYNVADDYWYNSMSSLPEKFGGADAIFGPDGLIYLVGGNHTDLAYATSGSTTHRGFCLNLYRSSHVILPDMDFDRKYHAIGYDEEGNIFVLGGFSYDETVGDTTTKVEKLQVMDLSLQVLPEGTDLITGETLLVKADFNFAVADYEELTTQVLILNDQEEVVASYLLQAYVQDGNPGAYRVEVPQDLPSGDYVVQFLNLRPSSYFGDDLTFDGFELNLAFVHGMTVNEHLDAQNQTIDGLQEDNDALRADLADANDKLDAAATSLMIVLVLALIAVIIAVVVLVMVLRKKN